MLAVCRTMELLCMTFAMAAFERASMLIVDELLSDGEDQDM